MSTKNEKTIQTVTVIETQVVTEAPTVITIEDSLQSYKDFHNAFVKDANVDPVDLYTLVNEITAGVKSDPEFAKMILTPHNIQSMFEIKAKVDNKTFKIADIEEAFPDFVKKIPMWELVKTVASNFM